MTKVEIILSIVCDETTTKAQKFMACTRVENEVAEMEGVKSSQVSSESGVADLTAFAEWEEKDIAAKIAEMKQIEGIKEIDARILLVA